MSNSAELQFPAYTDLNDWLVLLKSFGFISCEARFPGHETFHFEVAVDELQDPTLENLTAAIHKKFRALDISGKADMATVAQLVLLIKSQAA